MEELYHIPSGISRGLLLGFLSTRSIGSALFAHDAVTNARKVFVGARLAEDEKVFVHDEVKAIDSRGCVPRVRTLSISF
jgi:hypothetical protein